MTDIDLSTITRPAHLFAHTNYAGRARWYNDALCLEALCEPIAKDATLEPTARIYVSTIDKPVTAKMVRTAALTALSEIIQLKCKDAAEALVWLRA